MFWWVVIAALVGAALAYAYREHRRDSRRLAGLFGGLAEKYEGEAEPGNWLALPRFRFERAGRRCLLTAMVTDGTEGGAPFTLIELELPADTGDKIRIRPKSAGTKHFGGGGRLSTGDGKFDEAFRIEGDNQPFASTLLDSDVRRQLLSASPRGVEARVERNKIIVTMEGIARSAADLEVLIETAGLLADHCPRTVGLPESADS